MYKVNLSLTDNICSYFKSSDFMSYKSSIDATVVKILSVISGS